jgi:LmbE family N-acetylglucosaminyl deacetylase
VASLVSDAPDRALAVYAHPDDVEVGCGGTLATWVRGGCEAHVVVVCRGDKGSADPAADPDDLAERRAVEVADAAAVLGLAGHHLLGHHDGEVEADRALRATLVGLVRLLRPTTVICPDPTAVLFGSHYVNHRDHRVVGWSTLDAVAPAAAMPHYFPDAGPSHAVTELWLSGSHEPDVYVDIGPVLDVKSAAIACHRSMVDVPGELLSSVVEQRAEDAGRAADVRYAEAFRRLLL